MDTLRINCNLTYDKADQTVDYEATLHNASTESFADLYGSAIRPSNPKLDVVEAWHSDHPGIYQVEVDESTGHLESAVDTYAVCESSDYIKLIQNLRLVYIASEARQRISEVTSKMMTDFPHEPLQVSFEASTLGGTSADSTAFATIHGQDGAVHLFPGGMMKESNPDHASGEDTAPDQSRISDWVVENQEVLLGVVETLRNLVVHS